jgi:tRNA threonylcarbamoyladenosine biosynthesis protein TsaE
MLVSSHSVKDTLRIGTSIAGNLAGGDIICLFGDLGSGKTVLTKGIAHGLGIEEANVISPSFVLVREHYKGRLPLFHFDLYRLKEPGDLAAIGYEEYFYDEGIAVIEWAERLGCLLPKEFLRVDLVFRNESTRTLKLTSVGKRYEILMERLREVISH